MYKIKLNVVYYFLSFIPLYFLFTLDNTNNLGNIVNKLIAIMTFLINIRLLYLEFLKIGNKMKSKKVSYQEFFLYIFYFLAVIDFIFGVFFKDLNIIKTGFYLYLFGTVFVNQGIIYYDDKVLILGFLIINRENISNVEMKNKKVLIKYKNGIKRKINFPTKLSAQYFFDFLMSLSQLL